MMTKIAQGAEAVIYQDGNDIIKERFAKRYRLPQIDESLRKFRTRREAKVLQKLTETNFPAPHLKEFSDIRMAITMDFIPGPKVRDVLLQKNVLSRDDVLLQSSELQEYDQIAQQMGERIAQLHNANIIHGDLTTSNMLFSEKSRELAFIDFGLSFFSDKIEDKAVDLFLLERALQGTHFQIYLEFFKSVLESYQKECSNAPEILARFEIVKARGRNKK